MPTGNDSIQTGGFTMPYTPETGPDNVVIIKVVGLGGAVEDHIVGTDDVTMSASGLGLIVGV